MASISQDVDLDLQGNTLLNAGLPVLSSNPSPTSCRIYINSTDNPQTLRYYDTTAASWISLGALGTYKATVGNGSYTSTVVTHNLGTRDVMVSVYDTGSPYAEKPCQVERTTTNTITLTWNTAPANNSRRVLVRAQ